jgi:hypothetical protein
VTSYATTTHPGCEAHDFKPLGCGWYKPYPADSPMHARAITGTAYNHAVTYRTLFCQKCGMRMEIEERHQ